MWNQTIISMQQNYPFGACRMARKQNHEVMVRKRINTGNNHDLISKARHLKKLKLANSIHIISILEDLESVQIYYEYVPVKFEIWMKSMSDFLSDNLLKQLYIMTTHLAENKIWTSFNPNHLGLDQNYRIKYFLDLENTFYHPFQNSSTLKQKYYRQIHLSFKSFHSIKDKTHHNPLFSSLNSLKTQPNSLFTSPIRSLPTTIDRAMSFGSFDADFQLKVGTEITDQEVPENNQKSKISASKQEFEFVSFNQKLRKIQQKLQFVKEKGPKVFLKQSGFEKRTIMNYISIKKAENSKKQIEQSRLKRESSIEKLVMRRQVSGQVRGWAKKGSESGKDPWEGNQFFFRPVPVSKRNKSQKFKSEKNSESPIEYMDLMKSTSEYMQDFLSVLQDCSQQDCGFSREQIKSEIKQLPECTGPKSLVKTQQSQNQNQSEECKWRLRFDLAIQNSKKLIDRMRSPPKGADVRMEKWSE